MALIHQFILFSNGRFPLHPRIRSHFRVGNIIPQYFRPRIVRGEVIVVFWTHLLQCGQPASRNAREIVMLVVVADVEGNQIERAVVGVRFLAFDEYVVLCDEMAGYGVES